MRSRSFPGIVLGLLVWPALAAAAFAQDGEVAEPPPFGAWLAELESEARERGVSEATITAALAELEPDPKVIEYDRRQPEFTQTFEEYLTARVSDSRIERGRQKIAEHRELLADVAAEYGVQPRFIAAIWGMETNYGAYTGGMSLVRSLATLAWDRRRSEYFRTQLLDVLEIIDAGHIAPDRATGSWAGAMGQPQFMPASFRAFAQDFDGDGRRDIWTSEADVFASIANYLARHGWRDDMTWGRQVRLPAAMSASDPVLAQASPPSSCARALRDHTRQLSLAEWQDRGVRRLSGDNLPERDFLASLVEPAGGEGPAFLTYSNFRAILRYNCSNYYALAVGHLADALRGYE